jgi:hypothetical protein
MLTHERIVETQLVAKDDGLPVFLQRGGIVPVKGVYRHCKIAKAHRLNPFVE